jgi:DNA-binding XRE family transcriptional regulator
VGCGTVLAADNTARLCGKCYREQHDQLRTPPTLRNEFFETDEFHAAFESQHIGKVFKVYRNHPRHLRLFGKALNQELLGRWLGLTQAQVSKLENGKPEQNLEALRNYARILHLPQHMLWFDFPGQSRLRSPQPGPPPQEAKVDPAPALMALGGSGQTPPIYLVSNIQRVEEAPPSVAVIRAMSDSFQVADRKLGGGKLYHAVSQYLRSQIAPVLLEPPSDCSPSELFSAAASLTDFAGWMAHESGNDSRARGHFVQAYRLAVAGENTALSANICASMAHLAIQLELPDDADRLSTTGLGHIANVDGAKHLVARLHAMRARAYAMQGNEVDCRVALEAAHHSLDVRDDDGAQIEWIAGFDEASLASESALCFYTLGSLSQAEEESRKVIHLRVGDRVRSRTLGQLTLANVLAQGGVYDEAARVGLDICNVARTLNSARVHSGLSSLGAALAPHRATPEVAAFLTAQAEVREASTDSLQTTRWPV